MPIRDPPSRVPRGYPGADHRPGEQRGTAADDRGETVVTPRIGPEVGARRVVAVEQPCWIIAEEGRVDPYDYLYEGWTLVTPSRTRDAGGQPPAPLCRRW